MPLRPSRPASPGAGASPGVPVPGPAPTPVHAAPPARPRSLVALDVRNVWRVCLVVVGAFALAAFAWFLLSDGGAVLFAVLMSWFAAVAMEPAVGRLARRMPRGAATALTMVAITIGVLLFTVAFGRLVVDQVAAIVRSLPDLATSTVAWANERFGTDYKVQDILSQLNITPSQVAGYATQVLGGVLGIIGSVVGGLFSLFTLALFTFYLSADGPRLRTWVAGQFPPAARQVVVDVWDTTAEKTGRYVGARIVLAAINGGTSAVVFLVTGMPSWLALGLWTGLVAQFVPTIGTYIAIVLPVVVGLLSPNPWVGVIALVWALLYQQVENLTIEPRISAKAVSVHPAVAFGAVMLGAALFGVAGALLAVPVAAMLLSMLSAYHRRGVADSADTGQDVMIGPGAAAADEVQGPAADGGAAPAG